MAMKSLRLRTVRMVSESPSSRTLACLSARYRRMRLNMARCPQGPRTVVAGISHDPRETMVRFSSGDDATEDEGCLRQPGSGVAQMRDPLSSRLRRLPALVLRLARPRRQQLRVDSFEQIEVTVRRMNAAPIPRVVHQIWLGPD